jgi:hypothetical protein
MIIVYYYMTGFLIVFVPAFVIGAIYRTTTHAIDIGGGA